MNANLAVCPNKPKIGHVWQKYLFFICKMTDNECKFGSLSR